MVEALRFEALAKDYGAVHALRGIDLAVHSGEVFGFLGPNGSGKTTAIRLALDLIRPTSGRVTVFGHDAQDDGIAARGRLGYLPGDPAFYPGMTARATLDYLAAVRGEAVDHAYRDRLVERLQLDVTRRVGDLSRGNRQKVGLVQALMGRPDLVILDEPTSGLDPLIQEETLAILREVAAEGHAVFFSSHVLAEVEEVCDRAAVLRGGRLIDVFDLAEQRRLAPRRVEATFAAAPPPDAFAGLPGGVRVVGIDGVRARFEARDGLDALVKAIARYEVTELLSRPPTLEELFLGYYREEEGERDGEQPA